MESNKRRIALTLIFSCLIVGSLFLIPVDAREGYIMNLVLGAMHDVILDNPTSGQVLAYNGTYWTNQNATSSAPDYRLLCRNEFSSANTTIGCDFTTAKFIHVELNYVVSATSTNTLTPAMTFNGDSGTNYSRRLSSNGGADATSTGQASITNMVGAIQNGGGGYIVCDIDNALSTKSKLAICQTASSLAFTSANAPSKTEINGLWSNTNSQITNITFINTASTGQYGAGSILTVFGHD